MWESVERQREYKLNETPAQTAGVFLCFDFNTAQTPCQAMREYSQFHPASDSIIRFLIIWSPNCNYPFSCIKTVQYIVKGKEYDWCSGRR